MFKICYEMMVSPFESFVDKVVGAAFFITVWEVFILMAVGLWLRILVGANVTFTREGAIAALGILTIFNYFVFLGRNRGKDYLASFASLPDLEQRLVYWIGFGGFTFTMILLVAGVIMFKQQR